MPDLYPIPGFGPDEILEMARSAIRQVKDYKISITLDVPQLEERKLDAARILQDWHIIQCERAQLGDFSAFENLIVQSTPKRLGTRHRGVYSRGVEQIFEGEMIHCKPLSGMNARDSFKCRSNDRRANSESTSEKHILKITDKIHSN